MPRPEPVRRKVLLLEMNEVPWRIIDSFARRHPGSHLARLLGTARQYETVCEDQVELDPWTSWPTFHRGVTDEHHGVRHLGQSLEEADRRYPPIWEILARHGRSVGVFGSLHSARVPDSLDHFSFYVPDCFAERPFAHPPTLQSFQAFNLLMTRRSARNVDEAIPARAALAFARDYARSSFRLRSVGTIAAALIGERVRGHLKARRRSLQPLIGLDVFVPLVRRTRPDFATFYTNHVAANMHRFWAAAYPEDVAGNPMPAEWRRMYGGEVDYAMRVLDDMLGRLRALADEADYLLLAASSIGQAGVRGERTRGYTTIVDLPRFLSRLGVHEGEWTPRPAMVPCFTVSVAPERADALERRLASLRIGRYRVARATREGAVPFSYDRSGAGTFHLWVYFNETDLGELAATVDGEPDAASALGLGYFEQEEGVACSGRHTPFGSMLVYDPRRAAAEEGRTSISTLEVAPALLRNFGVPVPAYMQPGDPQLLDLSRPARPPAMHFRGGGVEMPVTRVPPAVLAEA